MADVSLSVLVTKLREAYPNDPSAPCVQLASLPSGEFYASAVRYAEKFGEGKKVVASCKASTLAGAMKVVIAKLVEAGVVPSQASET